MKFTSLILIILLSSIFNCNGQTIFDLKRFLREIDQSNAMQSIRLYNDIQQKVISNKQKQFKPTLALNTNGPQYNNIIAPVQQPDGTQKLRETVSVNNSLSLTLNQPIIFLGGNLAINSGISGTSYIKPSQSEFYSLNIFNISYSGSLFQLNNLKWTKENLKLEKKITDLEAKRKIAEFNYKYVRTYFNILLMQNLKTVADKQKNLATTIYKEIVAKHKVDQSTKIDLYKAEIFKIESEEYFETICAQLEIKKKFISNELNNSEWTLTLPEIPSIDPADLHKKLITNDNAQIQLEYQMTTENLKRQIKTLEKSKILTSTINFGVGMNTYIDDIKSMTANKRQNYSAGLTLRIPIVDNKIIRTNIEKTTLEYQKSQLDYSIQLQKIEQQIENEIIDYEDLINSYKKNVKQLQLNQMLTRESLLQYQNGKVTVKEVMESLINERKTVTSKIKNIMNLYILIYKWEYEHLITIL